MKPAQQTTPGNTGAIALKAFFNILERWQLGAQEGQILLGTPGSTYFRWKKDPSQATLDADKLERISYILGIYKGLHLIYSDESLADSWIKRPNNNPLFGGMPPLQRLLAGQVADLFEVRRHVDARRGII